MSGYAIAPTSDYAIKLKKKLDDLDAKILANIKAHGEVVFYIPDIDDIAEAYLEAFREVGTVIGIETPSGTMFFATCNPGWNGRISNDAIEFHNILLDAAEDEGWDVSEMEGL